MRGINEEPDYGLHSGAWCEWELCEWELQVPLTPGNHGSLYTSGNIHGLICKAKKAQFSRDIEIARLTTKIIELKNIIATTVTTTTAPTIGIQNNTNTNIQNTYIENITISLCRDDFVNEGNNELLSFGCERTDHLDFNKI